MMCTHRSWTFIFGLFILKLRLVSSQGTLPKPTFPDVFHVEIQGIFLDNEREMDCSMYYDRPNNRAALFYTYQNEFIKTIYNFNDDEFVSIQGSECSVSAVPSKAEGSFIPSTMDGTKKIIAAPEEIFYFLNSTLDRQELSLIPTYIYTAKVDFPEYQKTNCDVMHIFSKPETETPDCESHSCRPTLMTVSVKCLNAEGVAEVEHTYNYFRFRSGIEDESVFQTPVGVFCPVKNHQTFLALPEYFSFSYDLVDEDEIHIPNFQVYTVHKKVWYDSKLRLIRMDEFDDNGLLISSRIFDFYGKTAYSIVTAIAMCERGPMEEDIALDQMTSLPKIFFSKPSENGSDVVYGGKRNIHGLEYDVWSLTYTDDNTEAKIVQEFYFIMTIPISGVPAKLQLSHGDTYTYLKNDETQNYELSVVSHLAITNFRTAPKEWEAFDISPCFMEQQKKGFRLKVEGPPITKNSFTYEDVLERLYMKLISISKISVIRISELEGKFDSMYIKEFSGWILEKLDSAGNEMEPNMNRAYELIEAAAAKGKLSIKLQKNGQKIEYSVTAFENIVTPNEKQEPCEKYNFSTGTLVSGIVFCIVVGGSAIAFGAFLYYKKRKAPSTDRLRMIPLE